MFFAEYFWGVTQNLNYHLTPLTIVLNLKELFCVQLFNIFDYLPHIFVAFASKAWTHAGCKVLNVCMWAEFLVGGINSSTTLA